MYTNDEMPFDNQDLLYFISISVLILLSLIMSGCIGGEPEPPASGIISGKLCFPSDYIPEMVLYFQSLEDDSVVSLKTDQDQNNYAIEIEPGTYQAYAWLPDEILLGASYSAMVPCGLEVNCTDHSLLPVIVEPGKETKDVDICDWYGEPGDVPLPPGKIEKMIADYLRTIHPDLDPEYSPLIEEVPAMREQIAQRMSARFFRIIEQPYQNDMFLITHSGKVIQMGSAFGGQGVNSMTLADLDQDERFELYFSYSTGSGIHQSHIGMYAPAYSWDRIYESSTFFLGDVLLFNLEDKEVGVRAIETDSDNRTIQYLDSLGYLRLSTNENMPILDFEIVEGLEEEFKNMVISPDYLHEKQPFDDASGSEWWIEVEDNYHGIRYVVPCFWEVNLPATPPPTDAFSYHLRNYSEHFSMSFGKNTQGVWDSGGIKIDLNFISTARADWDLPADPTLDDMIQVLFDENNRDQLISINDLVINDQLAKEITIRSFMDGIETKQYLLKVSPDLFLLFASYPLGTQSPDVLAVLNSIALLQDSETQWPEITPEKGPEMDSLACPTITP